MTIDSFEIRVCQNPACGLRYPLVKDHPFGERCPHCLSETRAVSNQPLAREDLPGEEQGLERKYELAVLADNLRSAWNVGSILRSADGFGFTHAYLCGITPTPEKEEVKKTALGAEKYVTWSAHKDAVKLADQLKIEGWAIWTLELTNSATSLAKANLHRKTVLVVGNEVTGVDPGLLNLAEQIVYLPMRGGKRSFNVSVAFGAAAYALTSQQGKL